MDNKDVKVDVGIVECPSGVSKELLAPCFISLKTLSECDIREEYLSYYAIPVKVVNGSQEKEINVLLKTYVSAIQSTDEMNQIYFRGQLTGKLQKSMRSLTFLLLFLHVKLLGTNRTQTVSYFFDNRCVYRNEPLVEQSVMWKMMAETLKGLTRRVCVVRS